MNINVLISLHKGYGLGDAVSMSSVLRHVALARPHWIIDYQAEEGKHQAGRGIVANTFAYGESYPSAHYDAEVQICLYDTWYGWKDRPNTIVSSCLHERFALDWRADCGRYRINVSESVKRWATNCVPVNAVALHYQGVTARDKKDLTDAQAEAICDHIRTLGCVPYFVGKLPLGYNAEVNCAAISQCRAFVGIDSGPAKCAGATDTPSMIVWTGHHPAKYYDPAPNVDHLISVGSHKLCPDNDALKWFFMNNRAWYYDRDPLVGVKDWLTEVLK